MNKDRRKALDAVYAKVETLRESISEINSMIEDVKSEEEEYLEGMPESLQGSEKGETAQAAIDALESAFSDMEGVDETLGEVLSNIETAQT